MRILLQFPEGLKKEALQFADRYRKEGHEIFISASSCYGACDIALKEAEAVNAEKIIHFGHAPFVRKKLPVKVEYEEYHIDIDKKRFASAVKKLRDYRKIALGTTVQHVHQLEFMKKAFREAGIEVKTAKGKRAFHEAQVLGCDACAITDIEKGVDAVVFVGDGMFHPLAIDIDKPVFVIHPKAGKPRRINDEILKLRKRRKGALAAALDAKTFGVLVSTKTGQFNIGGARRIAEELEKRKRRAHVLVANEILPSALNNFLTFDCYINTACPRLADDAEAFGKPIVDISLADELLKMIDMMR